LLAAEEPQEEKPARKIEHLYILTFDQWGVLTNPAELDYAIGKLSKDKSIDKILSCTLPNIEMRFAVKATGKEIKNALS
jgi:hypothetical protein